MLHVSDNASEYLGHSIEEIMCQGDSIFDLVDPRDHPTVHNELNSGPQPTTSFPEERVFLCRLNLARTAKRQLQYHKVDITFILLQGRYIHPTEYFQAIAGTPEAIQPVFAAYCQPVINPENAETLSMGNTDVFSSQHFLDMTFKEVDHMCAHHLGYHREELRGQSWYTLLHPAYIPEVAYKHRLLCQEKEGSVLALIKMRSADGEWLWMHTVFAVRGNLCHEDRSLSPMSPFPAESSYPQSIDQLVPFIKQEPLTQMTMIPAYGTCAQIKVEIPMKTMPPISMFTPESSSPESSASLTSTLFAQPFFSGTSVPNDSTMAMEDFNCILPLTLKGTLPDLRDGLDDFFREVEQPPASAAAPMTTTASATYSPEQATDLFKYLGPALFGGPSVQSMESFRVANSLPNGVHCPRKRSWVV
nr:PAS fold-3 domain containing protein [Haemonchus contortus]